MSYCYSYDEERFEGDFDSFQEATIEAFANDDEVEVVFIGESDRRRASGYLNQGAIESLIENMVENAAEECGEVAENWLVFPRPAFVKRKGEMVRAYHTRNWTEEQAVEQQKVYDKHDKSLKDLTNKIHALIDEWADENNHQPTFWGVKNVKTVSREL